MFYSFVLMENDENYVFTAMVPATKTFSKTRISIELLLVYKKEKWGLSVKEWPTKFTINFTVNQSSSMSENEFNTDIVCFRYVTVDFKIELDNVIQPISTSQ